MRSGYADQRLPCRGVEQVLLLNNLSSIKFLFAEVISIIYLQDEKIILTEDTSIDFVNRAIYNLNSTSLESDIIAEMIEYDDGSFEIILNKEALDLEPFLS